MDNLIIPIVRKSHIVAHFSFHVFDKLFHVFVEYCFECLYDVGIFRTKTTYGNSKSCHEGTYKVRCEVTKIKSFLFLSSYCIVFILKQATLGFFALPNSPTDILDQIIDNLITLLCAILLTR